MQAALADNSTDDFNVSAIKKHELNSPRTVNSELGDEIDNLEVNKGPILGRTKNSISNAALTKQGSEYIPTVLPNESFKKSTLHESREEIRLNGPQSS